MWPGQDNRVYLQGHVLISNDWGNVSTNGETTTTTDDTTEKGGGDNAEQCGGGCPPGTIPVCLEWGSQWDYINCITGGLIGVFSSETIGEIIENLLNSKLLEGLVSLAKDLIEHFIKTLKAGYNLRGLAQRCADETINRCKKWGCSQPGGAGAV